MSAAHRQRRLRQAAALAVLGLHVLGLNLGLRLAARDGRTPPPPVQRPLAVRLLQLPLLTPVPAAATREARPAPAPARIDPPPARKPPPDNALQAITLPAEPATAPQTAVVASGPALAASGPVPLNLTLPRGASAPWRARNAAVDDPRGNAGKLSFEQKLADAMGGDGRWVEETIDADHRRIKRGNTCIYLQRPRAAQLDPFHPANRALPWQAGQPTRCN